jgi:hypothetical protein
MKEGLSVLENPGLLNPSVQGECAAAPLRRRVLPRKRAEVRGIGDVPTAPLAPPPLPRLLGTLRLAPGVAAVSHSLGCWPHAANLLGRQSVAFQHTSRRDVRTTCPHNLI